MKDLKHTPGPWEVHNATDVFIAGDYEGKNYVCSTDPDNKPLTGRPGWSFPNGRKELEADPDSNTHIPFDEAKANAKLIAAAPELLEALQRFISYSERFSDGFESSMVKQAKAAIKKATE
jgi:hypothetical protein